MLASMSTLTCMSTSLLWSIMTLVVISVVSCLSGSGVSVVGVVASGVSVSGRLVSGGPDDVLSGGDVTAI